MFKIFKNKNQKNCDTNDFKNEILEFENKLSKIVPDYVFDPDTGTKYYTGILIENKNKYNILTGKIEECKFWARIILMNKQRKIITESELSKSKELRIVIIGNKIRYYVETGSYRFYPERLNSICEVSNND